MRQLIGALLIPLGIIFIYRAILPKEKNPKDKYEASHRIETFFGGLFLASAGILLLIGW
ncbi:MAG: hypothetical protein JJ978_04665 [Roseivirga sp.]|jgi:hypothetical protein|uniref:hypothetical protein n=1 Tax=Roseivirga sp. TaxID=1964215 RepID=UPI001B041EE4|nr:hypothetical protein [Roseivirga sp.]MBO6494839.1 hypothetical protein [Roseivirga sp.]